jgi:hypothetical protein
MVKTKYNVTICSFVFCFGEDAIRECREKLFELQCEGGLGGWPVGPNASGGASVSESPPVVIAIRGLITAFILHVQ